MMTQSASGMLVLSGSRKPWTKEILCQLCSSQRLCLTALRKSKTGKRIIPREPHKPRAEGWAMQAGVFSLSSGSSRQEQAGQEEAHVVTPAHQEI